jgi:DNA-binding transcriptional regulator YiaG
VDLMREFGKEIVLEAKHLRPSVARSSPMRNSACIRAAEFARRLSLTRRFAK